jgi:hypothetical protein
MRLLWNVRHPDGVTTKVHAETAAGIVARSFNLNNDDQLAVYEFTVPGFTDKKSFPTFVFRVRAEITVEEINP